MWLRHTRARAAAKLQRGRRRGEVAAEHAAMLRDGHRRQHEQAGGEAQEVRGDIATARLHGDVS